MPLHKYATYLAVLAAVFKGLGSANVILEAAPLCYVADTTSPRWLSVFFSLAIMVKGMKYYSWLVTVPILANERGPECAFLVSCSFWAVYAVSAAMLLRYDPPSPQTRRISLWSPLEFAKFTDPLLLIVRDWTLFRLATLRIFMAVALSGFAIRTQDQPFVLASMAFERLRASVPIPVRL